MLVEIDGIVRTGHGPWIQFQFRSSETISTAPQTIILTEAIIKQNDNNTIYE